VDAADNCRRDNDAAAEEDDALAEEDPRLLQALKEHQAAQEAGTPISRHAFLRNYPDIAPALGEALAALDWVQAAAPQMHADSPAALLAPGSTLGEYRIVREVGRGGMGVVYEAVQQPLGRPVALKILSLPGATPVQRECFRREARAAARLHHTNIVPVYGVGEDRASLWRGNVYGTKWRKR
jgi:serine/threonine protein kinase